MAPRILRLAVLALAGLAIASPADEPANASDLEALEARGRVGGSCSGQSCKIADLSGSSGLPYNARTPPKDLSYAGYCCILRHNPSASRRLYAQNPGLRRQCAGRKRSVFDADVEEDAFDEAIEERSLEDAEEDAYDEMEMEARTAEDAEIDAFNDMEERAGCKPNTLIFAKGTGEGGSLGRVGHSVRQSLGAGWSARGVKYNNGIFGNKCVGLPGGDHASRLLTRVARKCPDSKIIMAGYSQGAMVARNGVAYSDRSSHRNLRGVVTFGDPFNGAPIRDYHKAIVVFCKPGDRVCDGRAIITAAHSSYVGASTARGAARMKKLVA